MLIRKTYGESAQNATRALTCLRLIIAALACLVGNPAWSDQAFVSNEAGRAGLLVATEAVGSETHLQAGLLFDLLPGWKIYWRAPGDAGYPPKLNWDGSTNIGTPVLAWPVPERDMDHGLQTIGYHGRVILPLDIPVNEPGTPVSLRASLDYLACERICLPLTATLALDLPDGAATPSIHMHALAEARAHVPGDAALLGWRLNATTLSPGKDGNDLTVVVSATSQPFAHPVLFIDDGAATAFAPPTARLTEAGTKVVFTVGEIAADATPKPWTLVIADGERAATVSVTPTEGPPPAEAGSGKGFLAMIGLALLGGLILNLMPCVLPVLSLKILAVLGHGGGERVYARRAFLASAAGIVLSFLTLAALLATLRAAGQRVGWGLQFQQPAFLGLMIVVLTVFAISLWDGVHLPMPAWAHRLAGSRGHHSLAAHFLSGLLATILATPCSAPFVGTAIGFALTGPATQTFAIFGAMGLGMSAPFLAVALRPDLATTLPKPGRWMVVMKRGLGLALAATALWLGVVLAGVLGWDSAGAPSEDHRSVAWTPFQPANIPALVSQGKVVFVDVTARWCISCKVNKLAVVERGDVAKALARPNAVAMQADWTLPDESIGHYLEGFGRFGIPFDAVYGPGAPTGIALPELLTEADVLAAITRAAGVP